MGGGSTGAVERDSAGVTIVESQVAAWGTGDAWTVDPTPILDIGTLSGDPDYQLFRVSGVARLSDGSIAVATGDPMVRLYDPDGVFVRSVGRDGDGPGEFRSLASLQRLNGDALFAWDSRLRRGTLITPEGEPLSSDPFPRGVPISGISRGPNGSYFGTGISGDTALTRDDGHARWSVRRIFRVVEPNPPVVDTLMTYRGTESYIANPQPQAGTSALVGVQAFRLQEIVAPSAVVDRPVRLPLARQGMFTFSGDRVFVGANDRLAFSEFSSDGSLIRLIRVPGLDRPITPDVADSIQGYLDDWVETDAERGRLEEILDQITFPDILPAYSAIHVSSDGYFWLAPYEMPGFEAEEGGPRDWTVLDPVGRWLGSVELPTHFRPMEFGADYVLGVWLDDFEVEYVQMLRISR